MQELQAGIENICVPVLQKDLTNSALCESSYYNYNIKKYVYF